jgi:hypothetical protein
MVNRIENFQPFPNSDNPPEIEEIRNMITRINFSLHEQIESQGLLEDASAIPELRLECDGFEIRILFCDMEMWHSELDDIFRGDDFAKLPLETFLRKSVTSLCNLLSNIDVTN